MRKIFLLCFCFVSVMMQAQTFDGNKVLPVDQKTKVGKLPNGITYYLRHNEEPKNRANFYIIRNAGALLENDDQNGLAHFLEHMAFNGTKNFPGNSLVKTLERHGISFGGNLNAYTSQNETVYNINDVPVTDAPLVDSCLLILHDWSYYVTLDPKDIDSERGVISEEWRTRRNSSARMDEQTRPIVFKNSKYAVRDVIGSLDVIQHFKPTTIRDFYRKWYRTDLEAIAICGDFDVNEMEAKVKKMFSSIPQEKNAAPRPFFELPAHQELYYAIGTDKEATSSSLSVLRFWKDKDLNGKMTYADVKDELETTFFSQMINQRIAEQIQKGTAPYLGARVALGDYVRGYKAMMASAVARPNEEEKALAGVLKEIERVRRYGFNETELERQKLEMVTQLESMLKEEDKISNGSYIQDMLSNFLEQAPIYPLQDYVKAVKEILPSITTKDVAAVAEKYWKSDNKVIEVNGPSEGVRHINEADARAIVENEDKLNVTPYMDNATGTSLIKEELAGSKVVKTRRLKDFDAVEWTLANGARVAFRHADYEKDQVALSAFSAGGTSQYEVKDLLQAACATRFLDAYGLGDYDAISLRKMLAGKQAGCGVGLSGLYETVNGNATPKDAETMFQMVYLRFAHPRFDAEAHKVVIDRNRIMLEQQKDNPQKIMGDSIRLIVNQYSPRLIMLNENNIQQVDIKEIERIYRDRFTDASDFVFIIVGNMAEDSVRTLVEKYIGSIPSSYRHEKWIDRKQDYPQGKLEKVIPLKLTTPKTSVVAVLEKKLPYSQKDNITMSVLSSILETRYTENIREKEGGTYGVSVAGYATREPRSQFMLQMAFDCEPSRANHLTPLLFKELDDIVANGVTDEEVSKVQKLMLKEREQSKQHNGFWMSMLNNYYRYHDQSKFESIVSKMKPKDVQNFTKKFMKDVNIIDMKFVPAEQK